MGMLEPWNAGFLVADNAGAITAWLTQFPMNEDNERYLDPQQGYLCPVDAIPWEQAGFDEDGNPVIQPNPSDLRRIRLVYYRTLAALGDIPAQLHLVSNASEIYATFKLGLFPHSKHYPNTVSLN